MQIWWDSLTLLQRIFACIAVPATLVLILQTLLSLAGLAGDHDAEGGEHEFGHGGGQGLEHDGEHNAGHFTEHNTGHEHSEAGLRLMTFRGVVAFLSVYGWGSLAISRAGHPWLAAVVFGLLMGLAAMLLVAVVMKLFISMQSNGAIELENAIGLDGVVYLTVPPEYSGAGKVNILLQERYVECEAITPEQEPLSTGDEITVTGLTEEGKLIISRKAT